jgi:DNA-binding XRE family transcriptional regulator
MKNSKLISSKALLKRQLNNKKFKKEYDSLEEEFLIATQVIKYRQEAKLTQKELALQIGTSQPAIARLESGNYKNLSLSFLSRVASALGLMYHIHFKKAKLV